MDTNDIINKVNVKIDNSTEDEIKNDFKLLVNSIVSFVANEQPRLLDKNTPESEQTKLFFKMIGSVATEGLTAGMFASSKKKMEHKFVNVKKIYPLIQKYSEI